MIKNSINKILLIFITLLVLSMSGCGIVEKASFFPQENTETNSNTITSTPVVKTPVPTIIVEENTDFIGDWFMDGIYNENNELYQDGGLQKFTVYEDQRIVFEDGVDKIEGFWYSTGNKIKIAMPGGTEESGELTKNGERLIFAADDTHSTYYSRHPHGAAIIFYSDGGTVIPADKNDYLGRWVLSVFSENGKTQTAEAIKEMGKTLMSYIDISEKYMDIASVFKIDRYVPYEIIDGHISFEITKRSYFMNAFARSKNNAEYLPLDLVYKNDVSGSPYLELEVSPTMILYYTKADPKYNDYIVPSSELTSSMPYLMRNTKAYSMYFVDPTDESSQAMLHIQAPLEGNNKIPFYEVYEDGVLDHYAFVLGDIKDGVVQGFENISQDSPVIHFYLKDMRTNPDLRSLISSPNNIEMINGLKFYGAVNEKENGKKNIIWACLFSPNYALSIESDAIDYKEGTLFYSIMNNMNMVVMVPEGKAATINSGDDK